jgi:phage shock protein E
MWLALALAISLAPGAARTTIEFTEDTLETVHRNIAKERAVLVDVRSREEWDEGHLEGSVSLRKHSFDPVKVAKALPPKKEKKILYTFCVVGMRARQAAKILGEQGYIVRALHPGYDELVEAGFERADEDPR